MAWWDKDRRDLHGEALDFATGLRNRQYLYRRARAEAALTLYMGSSRVVLNGSNGAWWDWDDPPVFNLIQTAVDWFTSMMVRNRITPYFLTEGGDVTLQRKAKAAQRATEGLMRLLGVWDEKGMLRAQDGHLFEAGGLMYDIDFFNRRLISSRVRPWECFVPEREARLGEARQLVNSYQIDRHQLAAQFDPGSEEHQMVLEAPSELIDPYEVVKDDRSDMILVHTLTHVPSGRVDMSDPASYGWDENGEPANDVDAGHDGRRVTVIGSGVLADRPWPYEHFGIAWYKPRRDPVGYWSRGIPETLGAAQVELIDIAEKIRHIMRRHAVPHLLVWDHAKINTQQWTNDDSAILTTRVPPSQAAYYMTPQTVPAELFSQSDRIIRDAEKQLGVSEMSLAGVKPPSIEHAPGMEHLSEIEMVRHTSAYQAFERAHLDDGRIIMDFVRELAQQDPNLEVVFGEAKDLQTIPWKDFDLDRNVYHLKTHPTNYFAQTPTAKFRQVKEMVQAGLFNDTPEARSALRALDFPDVESLTGDQTAQREAVEHLLEKCVAGRPDEEWIPDPLLPPELCMQAASQRVDRMIANDTDESVIDRVQRFWELAKELQQRANPPPAQPPANDNGAPPQAPPANTNGAPPPQQMPPPGAA